MLSEYAELATEVQIQLDELLNRSRVAESLKREHRLGGYLCITDGIGFPLLIAEIGKANPEKRKDQLAFAQEKARRLADHLGEGHRLSRESRDPAKNEWGGAIVFTMSVDGPSYICSFSGLPEHIDEVLMFRSLLAFGLIEDEEVGMYLANHPNEYRDLI